MRPRLAAPASVAASALVVGALLWSPTAEAGGLGIVTTAGVHADRVYSYDCDEATGLCDQNKPETQMNANPGVGLELILGDKDNKVLGIFRAYWLGDAPQSAPKAGGETPYREEWRSIGVINGGLQFGLLGDPENVQLTAVGTIGSGFLTTDFTEYIVAEAGVGGSWMAGRKVQLAGSITGGTRYRKRFYPTANAYVGVRYLFD